MNLNQRRFFFGFASTGLIGIRGSGGGGKSSGIGNGGSDSTDTTSSPSIERTSGYNSAKSDTPGAVGISPII